MLAAAPGGGIIGHGEPVPVKVSTEVNCFGERCQLWDNSNQQCSAKTANLAVTLHIAAITNSIDEITATLRALDKDWEGLTPTLKELTNELREIAIQLIPTQSIEPKTIRIDGPVDVVNSTKKG
jgi:hypothetical protein